MSPFAPAKVGTFAGAKVDFSGNLFPAGSSVEFRVSTPDALEVGKRTAPGRQLGVFDQHVRNVVLDGEPRPAPDAKQRVSLPAQARLSERTDQYRDEVFIDHGRNLLLRRTTLRPMPSGS